MNLQTIKDFAQDSNNLLDEAYGVFRSKTYQKFLFVEGSSDKKMLVNRGFDENQYYYLGMVGKKIVKDCHSIYFENLSYNQIHKMAFLIDNDYDHITSSINFSEKLFIHSICPITATHLYNDLEGYLVNSSALSRFLLEYGLNELQIEKLRNDVELESRRIGKYRAANELLKKEKGLPLTSSILVSFEIEDYLDKRSFLFLENDFRCLLKYNSQYKNYVDELSLKADIINNEYSNKWALSRGHDISELISIYLFEKFKINLSREEIEQYLRLSIDSSDLSAYSVISSLKNYFK